MKDLFLSRSRGTVFPFPSDASLSSVVLRKTFPGSRSGFGIVLHGKSAKRKLNLHLLSLYPRPCSTLVCKAHVNTNEVSTSSSSSSSTYLKEGSGRACRSLSLARESRKTLLMSKRRCKPTDKDDAVVEEEERDDGGEGANDANVPEDAELERKESSSEEEGGKIIAADENENVTEADVVVTNQKEERKSPEETTTTTAAAAAATPVAKAGAVAAVKQANGGKGGLADGMKNKFNQVLEYLLLQPIFLWPFPNRRRTWKLRRLKKNALENPTDETKQALYLHALLDVSPRAVINKVDRGGFATGPQVVAEYIKALVYTKKLEEYVIHDTSKGVSVEEQGQGGITRLLVRLVSLSKGFGNLNVQSAEGSSSEPLHVVVVGSTGLGQGKPVKELRRVTDIILAMALASVAFSFLWLTGSALTRRYSGMPTTSQSSNGLQRGGNPAYAPKEYNKENMPEKSIKTFKDVKGCDEAKAELEEVVEYLKNPNKFTRLGGKLPKGILLTGPPGTGKTLLAKATAGEAGVPFFYRAGSEFEEMFVGVGSRRVRSLFAAAKKKGPCIVFIDEIDAVGGSRKQWESHTRKTLNQLLVEMDGFEENQGIIVMPATNLPETLDPALTRPGRFDRHVVVSIPDYKGRKEILELYMKDKPIASDVDAAVIARGSVGFSGADLYNLLKTAACTAAKDGKLEIDAITIDASKDKILMGAERKSMLISEESKKLTAYHESGHAIVALFTEGAMPVHKATIMPRGSALGMVTQIPDKDQTSVSKEQLLAKLDVCMGGRVAEEMIFGENKVTTGARSDLQQATSLARHMVAECGMSNAVGPIYVDDFRSQSSQMQKTIDTEVVDLLKDAEKRVRSLLQVRGKELHTLAQALIERETLTQTQIKSVLGLPEVNEQEETISKIPAV